MQQQSIGGLTVLRAPRVGFGFLAIAMVAAFVAGIGLATIVSTIGPATTSSDTAVTVPVPAPAAPRGPLNAQDFGAPPQSGTTPAGGTAVSQTPPHLARVNVQDFGAALPGGPVPAARPPLNAQDFGSPPQPRVP